MEDPFTDGSLTNKTGGDTQGLVWYTGSTSMSLGVTNDNAGIGSGNALIFSPTADLQKFMACFPPVSLINTGDFIQVNFDFRYVTAPANVGAGLRLGIYNTYLTRAYVNGSSATRNDDAGYGLITNPGTNAAQTQVYYENPGNDILGGSTPSFTTSFGIAGDSLNCGTNKHSAEVRIVRLVNGDLGISARLDNGITATGWVAAASVLTYRFDEFALGCGSGVGLRVPFLLDNLQITAVAEDFDRLRSKWLVVTTAGTNYDLSDSVIKSQIRSITNSAMGYWTNMDKSPVRTYLWSDAALTTDSSDITDNYNRLKSMALGYSTWGGALYTNNALVADILSGLDWMYTNRYNETKTEYNNWWDWEIGTPMALDDICVMLYDVMPADQLDRNMRAIYKFTPSPSMTGANLMWKTRAAALRAMLIKDPDKLTECRDAISDLFPYVTSSDGFYTDGSFIQHGKHPYTCGYGSSLLDSLAAFLPFLKDSAWEVVDPLQTNVFNWVYDSFAPIIYRGASMDMVRGREISRGANGNLSSGRSVIQNIFRVSRFAPPADSARIQSMVKYWCQADTTYTWTNLSSLSLLAPLRQLLTNATIAAGPEPVQHKQFAAMARVNHFRPGFCFVLSLSSTRTYNYESINSENLHAWYTGDGMTYLHNSDLNQYADNFWVTINPYRMPGTTVDTMVRANGSGQSAAPPPNWVGGASLLGEYGAVGMELDAWSSTLTARKSWFMFDDEVVCLGAGITCGGTNIIETIVENRRLSTAGTNGLAVDGLNEPVTLGWSSNLNAVTWCSLVGAGGYYFPTPVNLNAIREARGGAWADINLTRSTNRVTNNYLTLWMDHGIKPTNSTYAYVVLPNKTSNETAQYAANPHIAVVENSTSVQAVRETNLNILAVNFWQATNRTVDYITCSNPVSIITRESASGMWLGISDPTQTNTGTVNIALNRSAVATVYADSGVSVVQLGPVVRLSINMNNRRGQTASAVLAYTTNSPPEVSLNWPTNLTLLDTNRMTISADASANVISNQVSRVEFYSGFLKLGETTNPPFSLNLSNLASGIYSLSTRATDDSGRVGTSGTAKVTVDVPLVLMPTGAVWRFADSNVDLGTAWRSNAYSDITWKQGPGKLGFGDGDEATIVASNKQMTTYFRVWFFMTDAAACTNLPVRLRRDDGILLYLNGAEVFRDNMYTGVVTFASNAILAISGTGETTWLSNTLNTTCLNEGWNLLAAEVHQSSLTSSDLGFDLELTAKMDYERMKPRLALQSVGSLGTLRWPMSASHLRPWWATNLVAPLWQLETNISGWQNQLIEITAPINAPFRLYRLSTE